MLRTGLFLGLILTCAASVSAQGIDLNAGGFLNADGADAGVPAFSFLKLPISARSIGMAAPSLTTDEEASVIQGNPAGLALVQDYYYSISHAEILGEFRHENVAFTFPTENRGTFGGAANILAATAFEGARDIDENPTKPVAYDAALGLAYGKSLLDGIVMAGGRLDLIRSSIDRSVAYGYGLNAGVMFLLVQDLRLAAVIKNLAHGTRYDTKTAPVEPLPLSFGVELGKPLLDTRWSAQAGIQQTNEGIVHYYAGAEWSMIRYLVLRVGYEGSSQDRELGSWTGLATGVGVKFDRLVFDYGYKELGPLGAYHAFTLNYSRKAKFRSRDEVFLEAALVKYHKGKYQAALRLARSAIGANPYNLKAQALAQKLQLELDRMDGAAIDIFYTANTFGQITSNWKNGRPIGGLARRKTKLLELKGAHGKSVVLDAGNLTNPKATLGQEKYIYGAYAQMPYDAVNIGSSELILGKGRWDNRIPFLCSQRPFSEMHKFLLSEKVVPLRLGGEIRILGALEPLKLKTEDLVGINFEKVVGAVRRQSGDPGQQRILILMLNGNLQDARTVVEKNPQLDAIILSDEPRMMGSPMKIGKTLICSPGQGGDHVGQLTFLLDLKGNIRSFRHFLIPLDPSVTENPELVKFLSPITVDPNKFNMDGYDDDYRAQVIAYVHAAVPDGLRKPYLQDLVTGRTYRIPAPDLSCSQPLLGYGKNKVAFLGEDTTGAREVYAFEPGLERLDTLTRMGGKAEEIQWFLGNNALLATYAKDGRTDLYRIDPWSRELRNLSQGKYGQVRGFGVTKAGDKVALNAWDGRASTLWVANGQLESPLAITDDSLIIGSPRWNPQGDKLAYLAHSRADSVAIADPSAGELRVFDFARKKLFSATEESRVRNFSWSADGKLVYYSAGVNLRDINAFNLDSMILGKATNAAPTPRSEGNPAAKIYRNRDGILFETTAGDQKEIRWMDRVTREEKVLVDSSGYNSLR